MGDRALAEKAIQILGWHPSIRRVAGMHSDRQFIEHWNTAGALMEKALENHNRRITITAPSTESAYQVTITHYFGSNDLPRKTAYGSNLASAIVRACVAMLVEDQRHG